MSKLQNEHDIETNMWRCPNWATPIVFIIGLLGILQLVQFLVWLLSTIKRSLL